MESEKINRSIELIKAGDKPAALLILKEMLQTNPNDATAWSWLYECVDTVPQKKYCLKQVLRIHPEYEKAREKLFKLEHPVLQDQQSKPYTSQSQKPIVKQSDGKNKTNTKKGDLTKNIIVFSLIGFTFIGLIILVVAGIPLLRKTYPQNTSSASESTTSSDATTLQKLAVAPFEAKSIQAKPNEETRISLDDGAEIAIPVGALSAEANIVIERNPDKVKNLPLLNDEFIPLSDFYNFEITGAELTDQVELKIPFDQSSIPAGQENGFLVAAIPSEEGWRYLPVESQDQKVILMTDQIGDPLIAWHFIPMPNEKLSICSPFISLSVDPIAGYVGTEFTVFGQVKPLKSLFNMNAKSVSNMPVSITLGDFYCDNEKEFTVITDEKGYFSLKYTWEDDPTWVSVCAQAKCTPFDYDSWNEAVIPSEGRLDFRVVPQNVTTGSETIDEPIYSPTEIPADISTPSIPNGAVEIPDVVGLPYDEAMAKLETLGFHTTWLDGSSTLELGMVYKQQPAAGSYYVPHRTTVAVYRTVEKIDDPCQDQDLSSAEENNCGLHNYNVVQISYNNCDPTETNFTEIRTQQISNTFSKNSLNSRGADYHKVEKNTYELVTNTTKYLVEFNENGFVEKRFNKKEELCVLNTYTGESVITEPTSKAIVETPTPAKPSECTQLNLTPEECTNFGNRNYIMTTCSSSCDCGPGNYIPIHVDQILRGTDTYETDHIGINSYTQVYHNDNSNNYATIVFSSAGFHLRIETKICIFEEDWTLSN